MNQEQMNAAMQSMTDWLAHPHELGKAPVRIECVGTFVRQGMCYYMFRYKKSFLSRWLLGVCGGYEGHELENCGHVLSDMEPYDPDTAEEDCIAMVESIRAYWSREASKVSRDVPQPSEEPEPKKPDVQPEAEASGTSDGTFLGFVLLSAPAWDKARLIADLKQDWGMEVQERTPGGDDLMFSQGSAKVIVAMTPAPMSGGEVSENAKDNYMWKGAEAAARSHQAHLTVAALDKTGDPRLCGTLFVQIMASCCKQDNVLALYTGDAVVSPDYYLQTADCIRRGELPILNWIWFQLYRSEKGLCCFTNGMKRFGRDEMEILDVSDRPAKVRGLLIDIAAYLLKNDAFLKDGNTIGTSDTDKHAVTRSKGVSLPGMTLKVSYQPQ